MVRRSKNSGDKARIRSNAPWSPMFDFVDGHDGQRRTLASISRRVRPGAVIASSPR
jgi:hypothetical protein